MKDAGAVEVLCSFCGRRGEQVRRIFRGERGSNICDECVDFCCELQNGEIRARGPAPNPRDGFARLDRITIETRKFEEMATFYRTVLGVDLNRWRSGSPDQPDPYIGMIAGVCIRLTPTPAGKTQITQKLPQFRFQVPDLEHAIAEARAAGGTLEGQPFVYSSFSFAILRSPDGSVIELVQDDSAKTANKG